MSRPTSIEDVFKKINEAIAELNENPEGIVAHLASIPGGVESTSPEMLQKIYAHIRDNQKSIKKAFASGSDGVFEFTFEYNNATVTNVIKQDPINQEFYLYISRKSKRIDGTKYANPSNPTERIQYYSGESSVCKIVFEALGKNIQTFVQIIPKEDEDGYRPLTKVNAFNKELDLAKDAVTRPIEVMRHTDNGTYIVKYAPYRARSLLSAYNDPTFTIEQRLEYFTKLLLSVDKLHKQAKLVHLDIKPSNILIDDNDNITLGDLDTLAKIGSILELENPIGTSIYMAPELMSNNIIRVAESHDVDPKELRSLSPRLQRDLAKSYASSISTEDDLNTHASLKVSPAQDIWSLGIILYEIIYEKRMDMTDQNRQAGMKLSEILGNPKGELDKYKSLIELADQMLNVAPEQRGSLQYIATSINEFLAAKKDTKDASVEREVITDTTNPITELIRGKTKESWPTIKDKLQQLLLIGASEEDQKNVNSCFKSDSITDIANAAIKILKQQKDMKIITDEQFMQRNRLAIIHKISEYLQPKTSSLNLSFNKQQTKQALLAQIMQHECIIQTANPTKPSDTKSFTKRFGFIE